MPHLSQQTLAAMAAAFLAMAQPLAAQDLTGKLIEPSQTAPIRDTPPSGFWRTLGTQIGETSVGTEYYILDQFDMQSSVGASQTWIQVAPVDPSTDEVDPGKAGWVYFGENASSQSGNFEQSGSDANRSMNFEPGEAVTTRSLSVTPEDDTGAAPDGTRSIIILSPEEN
ncbi:hypothetical protein QKW60_00240 [Defluviimonas aestuarii]|uniref:hypothetical protein n=1 Tax=Albidovulum aestuarii TaxID=1130726 RepID=UPI00249B1261|nr:hypothetical protein [Defluviimonas aestuarii]MDI3334829.1 hypothetical protein [Defluviimonas aestuarii]